VEWQQETAEIIIIIITFQSGKSRYYNTEEESIINMSAVETSVVESSATSDTKQQQCSSSSIISSQKVKLILPELTPAMQQDLALVKTGKAKPLKPFSIANRPEFVAYPLENIVTPHAHDVCKYSMRSKCAHLIPVMLLYVIL